MNLKEIMAHVKDVERKPIILPNGWEFKRYSDNTTVDLTYIPSRKIVYRSSTKLINTEIIHDIVVEIDGMGSRMESTFITLNSYFAGLQTSFVLNEVFPRIKKLDILELIQSILEQQQQSLVFGMIDEIFVADKYNGMEQKLANNEGNTLYEMLRGNLHNHI